MSRASRQSRNIRQGHDADVRAAEIIAEARAKVRAQVRAAQLTSSERSAFQSMVARGVPLEDAIEAALDGVDVETARTLRCPCECNSGGFCGGCGHAGCGGRA